MHSKDSDFPSARYWEARYSQGGNSGAGSYNRLAAFKAEIINAFVADNAIDSVVEFGAGDGNQLSLYSFPRYTGFDVSPTVVEHLKTRFAGDPTKHFFHTAEFSGQTATLALSVDVIFHLIEDPAYERYMHDLFAAATRNVIIYSSNWNGDERYFASPAHHVRHRKFTTWTARHATGWKCFRHIPNKYPPQEMQSGTDTSFCDFYFFEKTGE